MGGAKGGRLFAGQFQRQFHIRGFVAAGGFRASGRSVLDRDLHPLIRHVRRHHEKMRVAQADEGIDWIVLGLEEERAFPFDPHACRSAA
jgi:hypothetical protein